MEQLNTTDLTPDEKLKYVEKEVLRIWRGEGEIMSCPYCMALNIKPENPEDGKLCCPMFAYAAMAVMSGLEQQELLDHAAQIAERVHG